MNNSVAKIRSTPEGMNSRLSDTKEYICDLDGRMMEHPIKTAKRKTT